MAFKNKFIILSSVEIYLLKYCDFLCKVVIFSGQCYLFVILACKYVAGPLPIISADVMAGIFRTKTKSSLAQSLSVHLELWMGNLSYIYRKSSLNSIHIVLPVFVIYLLVYYSFQLHNNWAITFLYKHFPLRILTQLIWHACRGPGKCD